MSSHEVNLLDEHAVLVKLNQNYPCCAILQMLQHINGVQTDSDNHSVTPKHEG